MIAVKVKPFTAKAQKTARKTQRKAGTRNAGSTGVGAGGHPVQLAGSPKQLQRRRTRVSDPHQLLLRDQVFFAEER